jgi:glycosyltransferase involved in cell wall biosynthesis
VAEEFIVSVITPVYNAAEFVTRAVESALAQPETGEVLLIEDNSPDDSLRVCRELAEKHEKVRLLRHPDGGNHGAGASRNMGMQNAQFDYIGFVDADNFYLSNRFSMTKNVYIENPDCEGVYEAIGIHVENEKALERWQSSGRNPIDKLVTMTQEVPPEILGLTLIRGTYGGLTLDGLVLRKSILQRSGLQEPGLRLHQDTEFIIRCALVSRMYAGSLNKPVAMEGVHERNRFSAPRSLAREYKNHMAYWMSLYHWVKENSSAGIVKEVRSAIIKYTRTQKYMRKFPREYFPTRLIWLIRLLRLVIYPRLLIDLVFDR